MEKRRNPYHYDPDYYENGNTVRKLQVVKTKEALPAYEEPARKKSPKERPSRKYTPERESDRYERTRVQEEKAEEKKLVQIGRGLNLLGMLLISASVFLGAYLCIGYLQLCAESRRLDSEIALLEDELYDLVDANHVKEDLLIGSIDLDEIYQKAVGELGMVFPNHNEVRYYNKPDTSYVRQYSDIPETAMSILDKLVP